MSKTSLSGLLFCCLLVVSIYHNTGKIMFDTPVWAFSIVSDSNSYSIFSVDVANQSRADMIYTIPKISSHTFNEIMPNEEIDFAKSYYGKMSSYFYNTTPVTYDTIANVHPEVFSVSISASPDHTSVVANIFYRYCFHLDQFHCFGASELVLIQVDTKQPKLLWNLGIHDVHYSQCPDTEHNIDTFGNINRVQWINETFVGVSFSGSPDCFYPGASTPILALSVNSKRVIPLGTGFAWNVIQHQNELDELYYVDNNGSKVVWLGIVTFDDNIDNISMTKTNFTGLIGPENENWLFRLGNKIFFTGSDPAHYGDVGPILLAFGITPKHSLEYIQVPEEIWATVTANISLDNKYAIVELSDKTLWLIQNRSDKINIHAMVKSPIDSWSFVNNTLIIYRLENSSNYTLVDIQGNLLRQIDLDQQVKLAYRNAVGISPNAVSNDLSIGNFQ